MCTILFFFFLFFLFFQAEDGIRDLVRSRGLGDVYKRQVKVRPYINGVWQAYGESCNITTPASVPTTQLLNVCGSTICLLYTSDAADERSSVDLGGRRIIKKKKRKDH